MSESETQWQPTGLERFAHLEDKIHRIVEALKALRGENETLRAENQKLKAEIDNLCKKELTHHQSLAHLQKEREALRERVEKALSLLATVEMR
jgi:FtsZ-binding cell division protein ZapB